MEIDRKKMGLRIKQLRVEKGFTQEELAEKLGLNNKSSISQYENGYAIPEDDIKLIMSKIFECSLDYLLGESDYRNSGQIELSDEDIKFMKNIKKLDETEKEIIRNTMEAFLGKQEKDEKKEN